MSVVLALVAAIAYGVSDFVGGVASRRERALRVLMFSYPVGALLQVLLLPLVAGRLTPAAAGWGVAAGLAGAGGVSLFYLGLATGPMSIVAPLAAVSSALLPLGAGVGLGERPPATAYAGVLLAVAAVALVSRGPEGAPASRIPATPGRPTPTAAAGAEAGRCAAIGTAPPAAPARVIRGPVALALIAGGGFGAYFVLLSRSDPTSGVWPLLVSRVTASLALVVAAGATGATGATGRPAAGVVRLAAVAGALDATANLAYLLAVRHGLLALVAVLVALYPAATVGLARVVLGERTGSAQRVGLLLAAASVALIGWVS